MVPKSFVFFFVMVGSSIGAWVPMLWGASIFSFSSVIFSGLGAFLGIWAALKIGNSI